MEKCNMLLNRKIEFHKDVIFPNLIYTFNAISTPTPTEFSDMVK